MSENSHFFLSKNSIDLSSNSHMPTEASKILLQNVQWVCCWNNFGQCCTLFGQFCCNKDPFILVLLCTALFHCISCARNWLGSMIFCANVRRSFVIVLLSNSAKCHLDKWQTSPHWGPAKLAAVSFYVLISFAFPKRGCSKRISLAPKCDVSGVFNSQLWLKPGGIKDRVTRLCLIIHSTISRSFCANYDDHRRALTFFMNFQQQ